MNKKKFKKKHIKQNILLKENILTGKEDDEIFKEKKIFDIYGNIIRLEWLVKKKIYSWWTKKLIGAYNPLKKEN